jgi:hypothetical protein
MKSQSVQVDLTTVSEATESDEVSHSMSIVKEDGHSIRAANLSAPMRTITEDEINDQSKGDALGKTIVLLQLTWFLVQIIARAVAGLHITPLEITTVAYIAVSAILYGLWWKKPKDIRYPINIALAAGDHVEMYKNATVRELYRDLFRDILALLLITSREEHDITTSQSVPTFYSGDLGNKEFIIGFVAEMGLGCLFGAIHCVAWSFDFKSHTEQLIWRISSSVVAGVPGIMALSILLTALPVFTERENIFKLLVMSLIFLCATVGVVAYIIARLLLLALAFSSLRHLPPDALHVIPWTTIIPHFG